MKLKTFTVNFLTLVTLLGFTSCSTLVGNVKPVDQKSRSYLVTELQGDPWVKLDPASLVSETKVDTKSDTYSSEITDLTFQSNKTAAIISLNSACRKGRKEEANLKLVTHELLLGITDVTLRADKETKIENTPALITTIQGNLGGQTTKIRTVVLSRGECTYDLMYVSSPDRFTIHEEDFNRFVSSLKLR